MSARAAWRLEQLGFSDVYDYVAGKIDWFANGLAPQGNAADVPWAGDLVHADTPTCAPDERVEEVRRRALASGHDLCVVVNDERIVLGLLRGDALSKNEAAAGEVMELGPKTTRPHKAVEKLLAARSNHGVKCWIVSTSHGKLLGLLLRVDAERACEEKRMH
ncbi:MAG TPA: hypothetical protein VM184_05460 [Gaiellaceae bacterium]|nr:hypothetical protein [Gaiellaceae bacterium]